MDATKRYDRSTCSDCYRMRDVPWSRLCSLCLAKCLGRALRLIK